MVLMEMHPEGGLHHLPPLKRSLPRLLIVHITIVRLEVLDVECVAHRILGGRDVDDVCVVVVAFEHFEGVVASWLELGLSLFRESIFAEMNPHKISFFEDALLLILVEP